VDGSGNVPLGQKFLLKWSVPLSFVDVVEFGSSEDMGDNSRFTPHPHSGEKVVVNAKPSTSHSQSQGSFWVPISIVMGEIKQDI
jgi:hypothetical protein